MCLGGLLVVGGGLWLVVDVAGGGLTRDPTPWSSMDAVRDSFPTPFGSRVVPHSRSDWGDSDCRGRLAVGCDPGTATSAVSYSPRQGMSGWTCEQVGASVQKHWPTVHQLASACEFGGRESGLFVDVFSDGNVIEVSVFVSRPLWW
jgi:hypothetical protein